MPTEPEQPREWIVECTDGVGRPAQVRVRASDRKVVLVAPPGESAVLEWTQAEELRRAILHATNAALGSSD